MENKKVRVLYGRGAYPGVAEGYALVCPDGIAGNSGALGDVDGIIYEKGNVNHGKCITGMVLVVPGGKGSNGFSAHFKGAYIAGARPAAWVSTRMDTRLGTAAASMGIPTVTEFSDGVDPVQEIQNGDWVRVDGNTGQVVVWKKTMGIEV